MSVRKSLAWTFSGQIVTFAISFAGSVAIARLLSPHEMGVYAVAVAVVGILGTVTAFGINAYVIREVDLTADKIASAFTVNALINIALAAAILLLGTLGHGLLNDGDADRVLRLLAIPTLLGIFEFRPSALLQRDMQFRTLALIGTGSNLMNTALVVALASAGFSFMSMPYATILVTLARVLAINVVARRFVGLRLRFAGLRPILVFGLQMVTVSGVAQLGQKVSEIVLARLLGLPALGLYSRASNVSSLLFNNIYGTATGVIFAKLSRTYRETGVLRDTFLGGLRLILAVMWPLLIGLAVLARPAVVQLYGEKWLGAALPLSLLLLAQFVALSFGMNWELFVLRNETRRQARYEVARAGLGLLAFCLGATVSLSAAAAGRLVDAVAGAALYLPQMTRLSDATTREIAAIYGQSGVLTAAAVAPSLLLMLANGWDPQTPLPALLAAVAAGLPPWLIALKAMNHPLLDEVARLWRVAGRPLLRHARLGGQPSA